MYNDPYESPEQFTQEVANIASIDATAAMFTAPLPVRPIRIPATTREATATIEAMDTDTTGQPYQQHPNELTHWIVGYIQKRHPDIFREALRARGDEIARQTAQRIPNLHSAYASWHVSNTESGTHA